MSTPYLTDAAKTQHVSPRRIRLADNINHAMAVRGWTRDRLAREACLDIRTINRVVLAMPVAHSTTRAIAAAIHAWPWDMSLPPDLFAMRLRQSDERRAAAGRARTITAACVRTPAWRRILNTLFGTA